MLQLHSIQALRAIAAILVVYLHMNGYVTGQEIKLGLVPSNSIYENWYTFGRFGVDIFFVISGFIMFYVTQSIFATKYEPLIFFKKRVIRIAPIFWFFTFIAILQNAFLPYLQEILSNHFAGQNDFNLDIEATLSSLLFIPYFNESKEVYLPLSVGWTLLFEMFFYVIFTFILIFNRHVGLAILSITFLALIIIGLLFDTSSNAFLFIYTNPLLLEFLLGVFIAYAIVKKLEIAPLISYISIFIGILSLIIYYSTQSEGALTNDYDPLRIIYYGLPSALIVFGISNLEIRNKIKPYKYLVKLGDWSYSLYLCHIPIGLTAGKILVILGFLNFLPSTLLVLILISICIFTSFLSYTYIEKPVTKYLRKTFIKKKV